jgi:hypothetical protein
MGSYITDNTLLKYIIRLPPELVRYIKQYLPIKTLKQLRRIHTHELPLNYRLCKELNYHLYKKYIGFNIDISITKMDIRKLQDKKKQNKSTVFNPFSSDYWTTLFTNDTSIDTEISRKEKYIDIYTERMNHYVEYYHQSTQDFHNYKIVETP